MKSTFEDKSGTQQENLPCCSDCRLSILCKYKRVFNRVDYPKDVFQVECKLKSVYGGDSK